MVILHRKRFAYLGVSLKIFEIFCPLQCTLLSQLCSALSMSFCKSSTTQYLKKKCDRKVEVKHKYEARTRLEMYTFSDLEKPCSSTYSLSEAALSKLSDNKIFLSSSGDSAELVSVHALRDSAHSDLENTVELPAHVGTSLPV